MKSEKSMILFFAVVALSLLVNVFHPYLWGPDEPREAEIAREVFASGNYITPHLCGIPFVEKPPLYYNLAALSYMVAGRPDPGAARFISALLGYLMLLCVFFVGRRFLGERPAFLATAALLVMPQFYRAAHWILLDIGVGTFCCLALAAFAVYAFRGEEKRGGDWPLYVFYLACAGAFLTKSLIGIFHIAVIAGAWILIRWKWKILWRILSPLPMLCFFVPVLLWVWLAYRQGGIYFLHEHFINNTIGRFLHISLTLPGSPIYMTDVGNSSPWYFYFKRIPEMTGPIMIFLPLTIWDFLARMKWLPQSWSNPAADGSGLNGFLRRLFNGTGGDDRKAGDLRLFLCLWAFLPVLLLSLSSIKEVTYILPSYAALALLAAWWIDERIRIFFPGDAARGQELWHSLVLLPAAIAAALIPGHSVVLYVTVVIVCLAAGASCMIQAALRRRLFRATLLLLAVIQAGLLIGNTPEVMRGTRLNRKCYLELAGDVWSVVGGRELYIYRGNETLRGSIPFYGNRITRVIVSPEQLLETMAPGSDNVVIIVKNEINRLREHPEFGERLSRYPITMLPERKLDEQYVLISSR